MKKADVKIGGRYVCKVSGKLTVVQIKEASPYGGWNAFNVKTHRDVRIRSAARLRLDFTPLPKAEKYSHPTHGLVTMVHQGLTISRVMTSDGTSLAVKNSDLIAHETTAERADHLDKPEEL